jgi:hypothetical protein
MRRCREEIEIGIFTQLEHASLFYPFTLITYELFYSHFEYANTILKSIGLENVALGIPRTKQRAAAQNLHAFMGIDHGFIPFLVLRQKHRE